jgi:hypothetical protein
MKWGIVVLTLFAAACGVPKSEEAKLLPEERRELALFPVGRFVMLPAKETEGVYVMDSTDGSIRFCRPKGDSEAMGCGPAAPQ